MNDSYLSWQDWNYTTLDDYSKCRVDKENELNVYFIRSFSPGVNSTLAKFANIIINCTNLFDKNDFKTILITSMNGGGLVSISEFLLQMISPFTSINLYSSIRAKSSIKSNYRDLFNEINDVK